MPFKTLQCEEIYRAYKIGKQTDRLIQALLRIDLRPGQEKAGVVGTSYRVDGSKELRKFKKTAFALQKGYPGLFYNFEDLMHLELEGSTKTCIIFICMDVLDQWRSDQDCPLRIGRYLEA